MMKTLALLTSALAGVLAGCSPDAPDAAGTTQFKLRIENIAPWKVLASGTQTMKVDGNVGAAGPGGAFEITFHAGRYQKVSFATMLGQSNDWFFAPGPEGLSLYNEDGNPIAGDITSQVSLYDAGTEVDEEPGVGAHTGPKQATPDAGAPDPHAMVRRLDRTVALTAGGTFTLPAIADMLRVTLTPGANRTFTLRIENVSTGTTLQTSAGGSGIGISPVAWALHVDDAPLFTPGAPDRGEGLEWIAESGRVAALGEVLHALTGAATPVSPGVFAVHRDPEALYVLGEPDLGLGLASLAEDGNIAPLAETLQTSINGFAGLGTYDTPVAGLQVGPAKPGDAFELTFAGSPGDNVSFASMFGWSNDWFFATRPAGIPLFDADGKPMRGDVSASIALFDAGTEIDQSLAIGMDTGPQQLGPNTGAADPIGIVREVPASVHPVPASTHVRVTLEPI